MFPVLYLSVKIFLHWFYTERKKKWQLVKICNINICNVYKTVKTAAGNKLSGVCFQVCHYLILVYKVNSS